MVRAQHAVTRAALRPSPFDAIQLKILYPSHPTDDEAERQLGIFACDAEGAPYPVVIFLNGMGCEPFQYQWLLEDLVSSGLVAVLVRWVDETFPGVVSLTPGIDLAVCRPDTFGTAPPASAITPVLQALAHAQTVGTLAGKLDLDRIILAGHSAGGTVALESADPRKVPGVVAAFSYAAHTGASTMLGWPAGTVLPLSDELPLLLMGGTEDGVIAASSTRYAVDAGPELFLRRTFDEGIRGTRGDRYLAILRGANHFTIAHPSDPTSARGFLDRPPLGSELDLRGTISTLIRDFLEAHALGRAAARATLDAHRTSTRLSVFDRK